VDQAGRGAAERQDVHLSVPIGDDSANPVEVIL